MKNQYTCPCCNKDFEWDDDIEDTLVKCPFCKEEMLAPKAILDKGVTIGDYEIINRIGVGGMGEVYTAMQKSMKRIVALKILHEDLVSNEGYVQRFFREIRTLAQIEHPNIVRAIEAGIDKGIYYVAMNYIEGVDLKRHLDEGHVFTEKEALLITEKVATALKYVWEKHGILHRDVKPANIMLTNENEVKLMDLGISKRMKEQSVDLTVAGMMVGSPQYVSPEQARSDKNIDFRADIYSLGASLYHMLTGEPPFIKDNAMAVVACHLSEPVPDPRSKKKNISEETCKLIWKMMEKKPENRFSSWNELLVNISDIIQSLENTKGILSKKAVKAGEKIKEKTVASADRLSKIFINKPFRLIILCLLLIILLSILYTIAKKGKEEQKRKNAEHLYRKAITYIESEPSPLKNLKEKLILLDNVQKAGIPEYKKKAIEKAQELVKNARVSKEKKNKDYLAEQLLETFNKARNLANSGEFNKAINILESLKNNEICKEDREAITLINREIEYILRLKDKKEKGVD